MVDENLLGKLEQMAGDDDWRVRQTAAAQVRELNNKYFDDYFPVWREWVRDQNHFLRRAAELGLIGLSKDYYEKAWVLIEPLLYDENAYVRKFCGAVALSAVASLNPKETFARYQQLVEQQQNRNVRWNIATSLGTRFGAHHPQEALAVLHELARDERRYVWRAAAASLIRLLKHNPRLGRVVFLWQDIKPALAVVKEYVVWPDEKTGESQ